MELTSSLPPRMILDSINEGVYVTDTARRIVYWSKAAERITGWPADEIVGKCCYDDVLCHVDKDGHRLCGEEYCPLHRSIMTGQSSRVPIIVFAQTKKGGRLPLQVAVAPLRDAADQVVGGVETFRDLSDEFGDINRARAIQLLALPHALPTDPRIRFAARYVPHDVIGGDYYAIAPLNADCFGFMLADVTGHGVPAALYTMFLSSLWVSHLPLIAQPAEFAQVVSGRLRGLIHEEQPFAAALCGVFDLARGELRLAGAGNPPPLILRTDGRWEQPKARGLPLGLLEDVPYNEIVVPVQRGDCVLMFTDGAIEITGPNGKLLGIDGLQQVLRDVGYPGAAPAFDAIEERLLSASDRIRFDDDVTLIDVRLT